MKKPYIFVIAILVIFIASAYSPKYKYVTQDNICPDSPATLEPGDIAVITVPQDDPLNLREGPGLDHKIITEIPVNTYVTIIAGPICDGGYRWYEVGWNGQDGWSAEVGPDGIYNIIFSSRSNSQNQPTTVPLSSPDRWPDLLIGTWEGNVSCQVTFGKVETCNIRLEINRDINGQLIILDNDRVGANTQSDYKMLSDNQYYYCFDLHSLEGVEIGEDCFQIINANELNFNEGNLAGSVWGTLKRAGKITDLPVNGIIQIGPDIFVVIQGQRRLVPNPETLDALGISREMINNMGLSEAELIAFNRGPDIPDVIRDPSGFQEFKQLYHLYVAPNYNGVQIAPTQIVPVPEQYGGQETSNESESPSGWCKILPLFCASPAQGATNVSCNTQCVPEARTHRDDLKGRLWSQKSTSAGILADAIKKPEFLYEGQQMYVRVRQGDDPIQSGDLVIWPQGCGGVTYEGGHIGYVDSVQGILITVTDSNWGKPVSQAQCSRRDNVQIQILPCMKFISIPYPVETNTIPNNQSADKCSQYDGFNWLLCQIGLK